ncbi:2-keto-4-pentenoate hydratase/2-oxohepta-3-ene-1,7-dioic acid hydratase (catechol pathway) [Noviherbaspirillum humi]|uniref:2-keto-4-pentenoate hydratase/2-oxohepta-3-ene-1,7-dioic acid hydratase (Catechol pathway) n=1 Tax=Noviherbaspirillum humi TaxID=1688639 RepID=A0A239FGZ2_9BURK|nr:fumarylacetoacetate hydrolase family protein [Noviherbaspirillum humi]SNS56169.1 2-keto-4-pentenoate hydratase/2-oxohepta-3-ene-1,7-dioic acid hydratase (catechol pathway) [Noviherbaspirillum humi]
MRFATLDIGGRATVAAINNDGTEYCPLSDLVPGFAGDMAQFIAATPSVKDLSAKNPAWKKLAGERLLAPIPVPRRNIFCVGKNYHEHAREFSQSGFDTSAAKGEIAPEAPVVFTKAPSTVIGPNETVLAFSEMTQQLDYEAELAVIIGKGGRGISKADAMSHIWGYTIVNDVTARDLQQKHRQWFLGKSMDTFCPMGPWIVTADEVDAANLDVRCWINDELRQDANTSDLIFDIPTIISTISAGMTLQPGDVIATGTPAGVGIGFKPPKFLKSGDVMKIEIGNLGTLVNRVA